MEAWEGFKKGIWETRPDVRDFIQLNYAPYTGDGAFLSGPTARTAALTAEYEELLAKEREKGGVLDVDTERVSSLLTYPAGYLDKEKELIVGLQTDAPLKRGVNPFGGIRMAKQACEAYGYKLSEEVVENFKYKTTHNDGVFRVYTPEMRKLRKYGILTGLPDAYGRGRIIGDYRRVALYGVDKLIEWKRADFEATGYKDMDEENIRLREELYRQIDFLGKLKEMAAMYGDDISRPAENSREAVQWTYYAYLGAIKEQNGAAMSFGRVSTFLDIYFERDMKNGILDESEVQELVDQLVLKLRMSRQLRTPEYNELFAGDPTWVTESLGGIGLDGRPLVTRTSFRFLHTLYNLKTAPEPNLTVLWSEFLPDNWKHYCAKVSIDTSSIQYENDDIMRPLYGDDYGIACCVSAMKIGHQMQYFGARCNLAKLLLLAINGGRDEMSGVQVGPVDEPMSGVLEYGAVMERYKKYIDWLAHAYVSTMNIIHYMHDKYAYEKLEMALHDTYPERLMAFGAAGISVAADSLSAIKYARVTTVADETGLVTDYITEGEYPQYGNDDDRVDTIASELVDYFMEALRRTKTYRGAMHTLSLLTITSNVVYGKKTGATPCGRKAGEPFAPGANPMHHREKRGALASLNSVSKLKYANCRDGISNTFGIVPATLGKTPDDRVRNLTAILDGYFKRKGHHLNINVYNRDVLLDAHAHPEKYPHLTIRVSGYAVRFGVLSYKHREEVLNRTFFERM